MPTIFSHLLVILAAVGGPLFIVEWLAKDGALMRDVAFMAMLMVPIEAMMHLWCRLATGGRVRDGAFWGTTGILGALALMGMNGLVLARWGLHAGPADAALFIPGALFGTLWACDLLRLAAGGQPLFRGATQDDSIPLSDRTRLIGGSGLFVALVGLGLLREPYGWMWPAGVLLAGGLLLGIASRGMRTSSVGPLDEDV